MSQAATLPRPPGAARGEPLLSVRDLRTQFFTPDGVVKAVDDVSFDLMPGETLGVVGESGCGKSMTGLSIMRLIPTPPGKIVGGEVLFEGQDLLKMRDEQIRRIRGRQDRHDLPGPDDLAQSGADGQPADQRGARSCTWG